MADQIAKEQVAIQVAMLHGDFVQVVKHYDRLWALLKVRRARIRVVKVLEKIK